MFCPQIFGKNTKKDKNAIGNIISQPFKDLCPRAIRQAIYFIDFYKIIMRNFGMAIVIAISSKCQKLSIRNTNILHTIDYISTSPTDTDAQYLYIFSIISHIIVASISIDCKIKQKFDKLYQQALIFSFTRLANKYSVLFYRFRFKLNMHHFMITFMLLLPIFTIKIEFLRIGVISDATPFLEPTNQVDSFMMISQDMLCCVFKTQHSSFIYQ